MFLWLLPYMYMYVPCILINQSKSKSKLLFPARKGYNKHSEQYIKRDNYKNNNYFSVLWQLLVRDLSVAATLNVSSHGCFRRSKRVLKGLLRWTSIICRAGKQSRLYTWPQMWHENPSLKMGVVIIFRVAIKDLEPWIPWSLASSHSLSQFISLLSATKLSWECTSLQIWTRSFSRRAFLTVFKLSGVSSCCDKRASV